jgi:hypothetical protein
MGVPDVRARLYALAGELGNPELLALADALWRRPAIRRAPARSRALTPDDAAAVRREFRADPSARLQDLAGRYGVNIGRISEALRGEHP